MWLLDNNLMKRDKECIYESIHGKRFIFRYTIFYTGKISAYELISEVIRDQYFDELHIKFRNVVVII